MQSNEKESKFATTQSCESQLLIIDRLYLIRKVGRCIHRNFVDQTIRKGASDINAHATHAETFFIPVLAHCQYSALCQQFIASEHTYSCGLSPRILFVRIIKSNHALVIHNYCSDDNNLNSLCSAIAFKVY